MAVAIQSFIDCFVAETLLAMAGYFKFDWHLFQSTLADAPAMGIKSSDMKDVKAVERSSLSRSAKWMPPLLVLISAAWLFGMARLRPLDYDEFAQFHATWLVSQGLVPYADFHAVHPPFFWYLFAPVLRLLPEAFGSLLVLRLLNLLFSLGALAAAARLLLRRFKEPLEQGLALAALGVMALSPPAGQTLCEFRVDHLAAALVFFALSLLEGENENFPRRFAAGFLFSAAMALTAKMAAVPALAAALWGLDRLGKGGKDAAAFLGGLALGAATGLAAMAGVCLLAGADLQKLYEQVFAYHALFGKSFQPRHGLLEKILAHMRAWPLLAAVFGLGLWAVLRAVLRDGWRSHKAALALAGYALVQPAWVPFPHRQYIYTLYLAWALPLALFFAQLRRSGRPRAAWSLAALLLAAGLGREALFGHRLFGSGEARRQRDGGDALLALAPAGEPVAAQPPLHPVFRRDATFFWIYSVNQNGPDTEDVLWRMPAYADRFSYQGYLRELSARPPGLVVPPSLFAGKAYQRAVGDFLRERYPREYVVKQLGEVPVFVRKGAP